MPQPRVTHGVDGTVVEADRFRVRLTLSKIERGRVVATITAPVVGGKGEETIQLTASPDDMMALCEAMIRMSDRARRQL